MHLLQIGFVIQSPTLPIINMRVHAWEKMTTLEKEILNILVLLLYSDKKKPKFIFKKLVK